MLAENGLAARDVRSAFAHRPACDKWRLLRIARMFEKATDPARTCV